MKLPSESSSSEVMVNFAVYTSVRVAANPETNALELPVVNAYEELETKISDRKRKTKESASKLAMRDEKEDRLDASVMNLSMQILSITGNNREDIRYKSIFSKTPSSITSEPIKDKKNDIKVLIQKLNGNVQEPTVVKQMDPLQLATDELDKADLDYETALVNEQSCFDFEKTAQIALRNILVKTYGKLIDIKGKKGAEKYFKKSVTTKKKDTKPNNTPVAP